MLEGLQAWVADYYRRDDAWSYRAHRRIFDNHRGCRIEHTRPVQTAEYIGRQPRRAIGTLQKRHTDIGQRTGGIAQER